MRKQIVAIVGRPNVGKSTLFNRIVGSRYAIVDSAEGVTRDINTLETEWCGKSFWLTDTGGFTRDTDKISDAVIKQMMQALERADKILLLTDAKVGITDLDQTLADTLKKKGIRNKTFLVVNKVDSIKIETDEATVFKSLGLKEQFNISAANGDGVADLLDALVASFPHYPNENKDDKGKIKLAVIGRPNVGKSSFVNAVLKEEKQIVTDIAGTTRDSIDSYFKRNQKQFVLIDTAGLRKRTKLAKSDYLEYFSVTRTAAALDRADIAIVLIDATQKLGYQDLKILDMAARKKKGIVLCVNKWDLIEKDDKTAQIFTEEFKIKLGKFSFVPIIYISSLMKQRIYKAIDTAQVVWKERQKRISTGKLNDTLLPIAAIKPPWSKSGKEIKIKYVTQLSTSPPLFAFFANNAKMIPEVYARFLEGTIRKNFGFEGVVIELQFRLKGKQFKNKKT